MIGSDLHAETITVHLVTVGPPDADGVPVTTTQDVVLPGWNAQLLTSVETRAGGAVVASTRWRLSGPLEERIGPDSLVTWRGRLHEVEGEPAHFRGGALDHTELVIVAHRG